MALAARIMHVVPTMCLLRLMILCPLIIIITTTTAAHMRIKMYSLCDIISMCVWHALVHMCILESSKGECQQVSITVLPLLEQQLLEYYQ